MSEILSKPKSEMSERELQELEQYEFNHGPMRLLSKAVKDSNTILISLRNNHKLIAKVKAFDRHCNMILENVREFWNETAPNDRKRKIVRERFVLKMFLRGDSVIVILNHNSESK